MWAKLERYICIQGHLGITKQHCTLEFGAAPAALNKSSHYECEIRSQCESNETEMQLLLLCKCSMGNTLTQGAMLLKPTRACRGFPPYHRIFKLASHLFHTTTYILQHDCGVSLPNVRRSSFMCAVAACCLSG